jgi:hypothetical protein
VRFAAGRVYYAHATTCRRYRRRGGEGKESTAKRGAGGVEALGGLVSLTRAGLGGEECPCPECRADSAPQGRFKIQERKGNSARIDKARWLPVRHRWSRTAMIDHARHRAGHKSNARATPATTIWASVCRLCGSHTAATSRVQRDGGDRCDAQVRLAGRSSGALDCQDFCVRPVIRISRDLGIGRSDCATLPPAPTMSSSSQPPPRTSGSWPSWYRCPA